MANSHDSTTAPARRNPVHADASTRRPEFPPAVVRVVMSTWHHHGSRAAATALREFYPVLNFDTALCLVVEYFPPRHAKFVREADRANEAENERTRRMSVAMKAGWARKAAGVVA